MTTHLILVSHAPTAALRTASFPGDEPLDPPIASLPEMHAEIAGMGTIAHALASPERRAVETAAALRLETAFATDPALRDCNYGRWTGRSLAEIQEEEPDAVAEWIGSPEACPHGGESILDLLKRVAAWVDERGRVGGRVVAVTHPSVVRAVIIRAIDAPSHSFWRINVEPLSITDIRGNNGRWTLRALAQPRALGT